MAPSDSKKVGPRKASAYAIFNAPPCHTLATAAARGESTEEKRGS